MRPRKVGIAGCPRGDSAARVRWPRGRPGLWRSARRARRACTERADALPFRERRHSAIAVLGIVCGTLLGGLLGSLGLVTCGLLGYGLMSTAARRLVHRVTGPRSLRMMERLVGRGAAWAIVLTRGLPLQRARGPERPGTTLNPGFELVGGAIVGFRRGRAPSRERRRRSPRAPRQS